MYDLSTSELYIKQLAYEKEMVDLGREHYFDSITDAEDAGRGADTSYARSIVMQVAGKIADAVRTNLNKSKNAYVAPLKELKYERAVIIALRNLFVQVTMCVSSAPLTRSAASIAIAEAIQLELKMQSLCEFAPEYMNEVKTSWKSKKATSVRHKSNVVNHIITDSKLKWAHWDKSTKVGVGGMLLLCICGNSDIFQMRTHRVGRNRSETVVEFTENAEEWIAKHKELRSWLRPLYRPMVVPPIDWTEHSRPYLSPAINSTLQFIRVKTQDGRLFYRKVNQNMYTAVSLAQSTPWRINGKVFDFLGKLMKLKHPMLVPEAASPEKPPCAVPRDLKPEDMDSEQFQIFRDWKSEVRSMYTDDIARRSNRNRLHMVMDIADEYSTYQKIYFPHSADSRGRIYSIPTILQPQGDDLCKGILEFADGQRLTPSGLHQLKLHIAAKYGHDKESHTFRLSWFEDNELLIRSVATSPLDHLEWLAGADKPFQLLAAIFDYLKWYKNPDAIIRARVNKDGACNGLQHFSALLRDGDVGESVNLTPSTPDDTPRSIYKVVAKEAQKLLEARKSDPLAAAWLLFWQAYSDTGEVDYKCVKRPVMTLPYSATMFSRMKYIKVYIREKNAHKFFGDKFGTAVKYFSDIVTEAMNTRVASARLILDWLTGACRDIMVSGDSVQWTTPLGFDVFNRKNKQVGKQVAIKYEGRRVQFRIRETTPNADIAGMAAAIAPNFVHSLDACHMLRLVKRAVDCNITSLHLVHDDYGCHVNNGVLLSDLAKEEFARMYIDNNPLQEFYERYADVITCPPPAFMDTLDLRAIIDSTYAFD